MFYVKHIKSNFIELNVIGNSALVKFALQHQNEIWRGERWFIIPNNISSFPFVSLQNKHKQLPKSKCQSVYKNECQHSVHSFCFPGWLYVGNQAFINKTMLLLIDDNKQVRRMIRSLIEDLDGEIFECSGDVEAVASCNDR